MSRGKTEFQRFRFCPSCAMSACSRLLTEFIILSLFLILSTKLSSYLPERGFSSHLCSKEMGPVDRPEGEEVLPNRSSNSILFSLWHPERPYLKLRRTPKLCISKFTRDIVKRGVNPCKKVTRSCVCVAVVVRSLIINSTPAMFDSASNVTRS